MPPIRTLSTAAKPLKTERTHEENQERAYIAASRRSDRSLEARIESARRASEIHKKRTGRALRVTEQDVVNEEMYEEEDDDLPTQYQRLSAHLQSGSMMFNRKLSDYIATQAAVRNQFMQQYSGFPQQQFSSNTMQFPTGPMMNPYIAQPQMLPPQMFHQSPQTFAQPSSPFPGQGFQQQQTQQAHRQAPYAIPQRSQPHQRSASIATPQPSQHSSQLVSPTGTTPPGDGHRRMSLPPQVLAQASRHSSDGQPSPPLSRSTTNFGVQGGASPSQKLSNASTTPPAHGTSTSQSGSNSPTLYPGTMSSYPTMSQALNMGPLTLSLPPESQQFVGSALDPNDPRTSILMAGSEHIPQPFYTYNPNLSPKSSRMSNNGNFGIPTSTCAGSTGLNQTMAPSAAMHLDTSVGSASSTQPPSAMSDALMSPSSAMKAMDYPNFDSFPGAEVYANGYGQEQQDEFFDDKIWFNDAAFEN